MSCDVARAAKAPVGGYLIRHYFFNNADLISYGNAFKCPAFYLLKDDLAAIVCAKLNRGHASLVFNPGAVYSADNFIAVMVEKKDAYTVKPGKVNGCRVVV